MSIHRFIVEVHYQEDGINSRTPDSIVAEMVKAALYKTYADPARETPGIESVAVHGTVTVGAITFGGEGERPTLVRGRKY